MAKTVGALTHPSALGHDAGARHPERRARLEAILAHLERTGMAAALEWAEPEPAADATVSLVHDPAYVDRLHRADAAGGEQLDPDTRLGPGSLEAALRGSQAAVDCAAAVLEGRWTAGLSLMRPPGHHATGSRAMGFCLLNHAAVAARWAVREGGASRVLVLDWDAHHGNGTQDIFWEDPDVMYASIHQYPYYPGTGAADETGAGAGAGTTVNVPLPAGSSEDAYARALDEVILPAAHGFGPDLTIVSAGFDAHARDPLCMMRLGAGAYHRFTRRIEELGTGAVFVLEGGYDLQALAWGTAATISALLGAQAPAGIPPEEAEPRTGDPHAHAWVDRAARVPRTGSRVDGNR